MISKLQLKVLVLLLCYFSIGANSAHAFEWRERLTFSVGLGLGDTNISKDVNVQDTVQSASRSESPGLLQFAVEADISTKWTLAFRHNRGVRLSPFSSGISFTGLVVRRYFTEKRPYLPPKNAKDSVTLMNWAPYVGLGSGIAVANTTRERDVVADVDSSGFYMGIHIGADYHMFPQFIFRPEIVYSTTLMDDSAQPATISEVGLMINLLFKI